MTLENDKIIERLREIFIDIVMSVEDSEFDAPEDRTGAVIDFLNYRIIDDTMLHIAALRGELEGAELLV